MNLPENYLPIIIQAVVAIGFVAVSLLGAHFLGRDKKNPPSIKIKISSVESRAKATQERRFPSNISLPQFSSCFSISKSYFFIHMP